MKGGFDMKFSQMPYERIDIEKATAFSHDIVEKIKNAQAADEVLALHKSFSKYAEHVATMGALSYTRHTINTKDEFYDKENDYYDEVGPVWKKVQVDFYKAMLASPFRAKLEESLGSLWFTNAEMVVAGFDEKLIAEMQKQNALSSAYAKLLASASLDFDGKKVNLSQLRAYQLSADRQVRKAAYAKRTEFFVEHADELDRIFDELVSLRHQMGKKMGFENYIPLGYINMKRNSYDAATVKRFRDQVKKALVPFATKLHEQRAKLLGVDKLKFYDEDIFFPAGNPAPKGTPDEMFAWGRQMYTELSSETREFIDFMLENELFDVLAKEGKAGGGYCISFDEYGAPFVFANFNGTSEDVDVLTHECGHALNFYLSKDIAIPELRDSTYDVAEIHSMSMEFFTADWMKLFFKEDTDKYLYMHLASALLFLPYGCLVDEFQHEIYENPHLTPEERKTLWRKLEKEYRPHLDYDGDPFFSKGGTWQRQSHIYQRPFYYIDYCIAQTCALQYRVWMEEDRKAAWESYLALSKKGGTKRLTDLIAEAGLKSPFEEGCMETIVAGAEKILKDLASRL
jgi:M3 family oligoendopeptidase